MKKPLMLWSIGLAGVALAAQQHLDYYSASRNIELHGTSGIITLGSTAAKGKSNSYHFDIRGGSSKVHAIVHDEGLEFFSDRVQGDAIGGQKDRNGITNATASGGVRVVKKSEGRQSEMTSSVAKYTRSGTLAKLDMTGPVKLTDSNSEQKRSLVATGSSAIATLASDSKSGSPLRTATLRGPVSIEIEERVSTGGLNTTHAKGQRLDIDNTATPPHLVLSGGVSIDSPQFGHLSGISRVVLNLNDKGEVVSIDANSGGGK